jgi:FdhD protein
VTVRTPIRRFQNGTFVSRPDSVAGEEPLEIRIGGVALSTTMRTPGHDIELAHGLLHAEGIIAAREDVIAARYCSGVDSSGQNTYNVLEVSLANPSAAAALPARAFVTNSACGVCGTSTIEALQRVSRYELPREPLFDPELISSLPDELRARQQVFRSTGGIHAAALVGADGQMERVREDVGRHNAVDKVIGAALLADEVPITDRALLVSSRASFELVQKAVMAGVGTLIAVSAPSSLAVQLATATGLTLIGFTSERGFNIYAGASRVRGAAR